MLGTGSDTRHPINILTGFLGSGKTTLLRRLLADDAFARCAVLVNELGEMSLDHELLERIDQETVVLSNGCICCGVRTDLAAALLRLVDRRGRDELPPFDRVVIETTGLADPTPVINTVIGDAALKHHFRIGTVVTTVDAMHGTEQLNRYPESRKQAAVADRIVITKADLVDDAQLQALWQSLMGINPYSSVVVSHNDASETDVLMAQDLAGDGRAREASQWFRPEPGHGPRFSPCARLFGGERRPLSAVHGSVRTLSLAFTEPLNWAVFGVWLSMLLHCHGGRILRVKGILNLQGVDVPTVVHGVQHTLHPPVHLAQWPSEDHRSRLVFIGELPTASQLERSLALFNRRAG